MAEDFVPSKIEISLTKYLLIMEQINSTNIKTDMEFQRKFNGFYRIRQRPKEFYECYYDFLEKNKNNESLTFEEVLNYLYNQSGSVEASFSSKLLATVNPNMPIWDKFVIQNLKLKVPYYYDRDRLVKTALIYEKICNWYKSDEAHNKLALFNQYFPNVNISDTKKIDYILWQTR